MNIRIASLLSVLIASPWSTIAAMAADLEGTAWRLLNITSMDDSVDLLVDPKK